MPDIETDTDTSADTGTTDIRADLSAAMDKVETATEASPPPVTNGDAKPEVTEPPKPTKARDESGKFAKGDKTDKVKPLDPLAPVTNGEAKPPVVAAKEPPKFKAPLSWKPEVRAEFAALTPRVQEEIHKRELEVRGALQRAKQTEDSFGKFRQVIQPFEQAIRVRGGEVIPTIQNLLQTAEALYSAPVPMKAQLVARMVQNFGIPVEALADALNGVPPPQQNQQQPQTYDPRVDQLVKRFEQRDTERQTAINSHYDSQVEEWKGTHAGLGALDEEEAAVVMDEMADLLEAAGKRGRKMSFDDAYKAAVQLYHPDIAANELQRVEAEKAPEKQRTVERLRNASSSVKNEAVGGPSNGPPPGEDRRSDVLDSIRKLSAR
jgi:hypothetical protein